MLGNVTALAGRFKKRGEEVIGKVFYGVVGVGKRGASSEIS